MEARGTYRSVSPMGVATAYAVGLVAALLPAFASIYNPHQYAQDPLFEPVAIRNALLAVGIAVPLAWFFGRKWSLRLVSRLVAVGFVATLASIAFLVVAGMRPMRESGPFMLAATLSATIAIPCCGLVTVAMRKPREK